MKSFTPFLVIFAGMCQAEFSILNINTSYEVENELQVSVVTITNEDKQLFENQLDMKVLVKKNLYDPVANQLIFQYEKNRFVYHRQIENEPYYLFRRYHLPFKSSDFMVGNSKPSKELSIDEVNNIGILIDSALSEL